MCFWRKTIGRYVSVPSDSTFAIFFFFLCLFVSLLPSTALPTRLLLFPPTGAACCSAPFLLRTRQRHLAKKKEEKKPSVLCKSDLLCQKLLFCCFFSLIFIIFLFFCTLCKCNLASTKKRRNVANSLCGCRRCKCSLRALLSSQPLFGFSVSVFWLVLFQTPPHSTFPPLPFLGNVSFFSFSSL